MTNEQLFSSNKFQQLPVIGILRGYPLETIDFIAKIYFAAGFSNLEVTMNSPNALDAIGKLRTDFPGSNIGAGTVCTLIELENALQAGAQFIVTPILNEAVVSKAVALNIPIFPGAYTPTEIYKAWELGASAVKVFPASQLGPAYIKEVLAPLNQLKLIPTGGVGVNDIAPYLNAGAFGVGMGSGLFPHDLIIKRDVTALSSHFKKISHSIAEYTLHEKT